MTTKFTSTVFRETDHSPVRDGSRYREVIVGLEQGDVISVRLKGTQKKLYISASRVYDIAMKKEGERLLAEKRS